MRMTHDRTVSDQDYYRRLVGGEQPGQQAWMTTHLILAQVSTPGTWLDIGCGSGFLLGELAKAGFSGIGIEPGEWGQIAAREKKISVIKGFLTRTTFTHPFDYVSATDVLEHVAAPLELLRLIRHYVSPGGKAFLSFPCADAFPARLLGTRWNMVAPPSHCQFFSRTSFRRLCGMMQMEISGTWRYGMHWLPGALRKPGILAWLDRTVMPRFLGDQLLVAITPSQTAGQVHAGAICNDRL